MMAQISIKVQTRYDKICPKRSEVIHTVQAPEKVRKYTIKCAEIIQAYKEAMEYTETYQSEPKTILREEYAASVKTTSRQHPPGVFLRAFGVFILLLFVIPFIFIIAELLRIYPAFTKSMSFIFNSYNSMSLENPLRMIISFPLALILGAMFYSMISLFTTFPVLYLWNILSETKYEKYMYKVGFVILTSLNIFVIYYFTSLHWPFEHRANSYYNFLYHLCRFLSWSYGPIYMLSGWVMDILN